MSARLKFTFQAQKDAELDVEKDAIVKLVEKVNDFWYKCSIDGKEGLVQANYMEILKEIPTKSEAQAKVTPEVTSTSEKEEDKTVEIKEENTTSVATEDSTPKNTEKNNDESTDKKNSTSELAEVEEDTKVIDANNNSNIPPKEIKATDASSLSTIDKKVIKKWMKLTDSQYEKIHAPTKSICEHLSTEHIVTIIDFCQILGAICGIATSNASHYPSFTRFSTSLGYIFSLTVLDFGSIFDFEILWYLVGGVLILYQWFSFYLFYIWASKHIGIFKKCKKKKKINKKNSRNSKKLNKQNMSNMENGVRNNEIVAAKENVSSTNGNNVHNHGCFSKLGWKLQLVVLYILYLPSCRSAMILGDVSTLGVDFDVLKYIILPICWFPLLLNMMFMILMINKYSPVIHDSDEIFGKGQHLESHADVKFYDLLHHNEEHVKSPFRFLYAPFKRERRYTRVYHFGFKAVAIFLLYSTKDNPIRMYFYGQSFYSMIYLIFPGPYTSIQTNRVNLYSALTIWLLSTVTVQSEGYVTDGSKVYADSLLLTILALLFCYAIINLLLIGKINLLFKNFRNVFQFEDTSSTVHKIGFVDVIKSWDVGMEIKHRLWHPFWEIILREYSGSEISKRWTEMQDLVATHGISRIVDHFKQEKVHPGILEARQYLMSTCEGVDCWYDPDDESDKNHVVKNCFCKLETLPFPFTCVLYYDSGEKVTLFDGKSILKIAEQNKSSIAAIRKETRLTLRALAKNSKIKIHFPYKEGRYEPVKVKGGVMKDIDMDLEFEEGRLVIKASDGSLDIYGNPGFDVTMNYADGFGRCEYKAREYTVHDRPTSIKLDDLGVDKDFSPMEDEDHCIVTSGKIVGDEDIGMLEYDVKTLIYEQRKSLYDQTVKNEKTLPTSFWWEIFNVPGMSRSEIINWLKKWNVESPGILKIYEDNVEAFDYIYARIGHLQGDPAAEMWYIFWHDIWVHNRNLLKLRSLRKMLNPANPSAICYNVMERNDLEKLLKKARALNSNKESDNLFSQGMLDLLYFRLTKLTEWSEISTSSSSRKAKGEIVHMNTIQARNANEKLQPMLQRAKERGHDVTGMMSKKKFQMDVVVGTFYVGLLFIVINISCLASPTSFCGSTTPETAVLQTIYAVLFILIIFLARRFSTRLLSYISCCLKANSSSKYKNGKVQPENEKLRGESPRDIIRWWKDDEEKDHINFNEHASVMEAAQVAMRKGKSCEVEAEMSGENPTVWYEFAVKHFTRSVELLDILPLNKTFSQLGFVKDRLASLTAFLNIDGKDSYGSARKQFILTAELWLRALHQKLVNDDGIDEAKLSVARCYQRACLCAFCENRWDIVQDLTKEGEEYLPGMKEHKPMKLLLKIIDTFFSLSALAFEKESQTWLTEWKLSLWYKKAFKIISKIQSNRVERAIELTKPDHDAELEDCKSLIKIIILGQKGSGKTDLFVRYLYNTFVSDPNMVLGSKSEYSKIVEISDEDKYKIIVEEMDDPKKFSKIKDTVYGVIYTFDDDNMDHEEWLNVFTFWSGKLTIVKTKIDDKNKSSPSVPEHVRSWVKANLNDDTNYFSVSAKTGTKVHDAFEDIVKRCGALLAHLHD